MPEIGYRYSVVAGTCSPHKIQVDPILRHSALIDIAAYCILQSMVLMMIIKIMGLVVRNKSNSLRDKK